MTEGASGHRAWHPSRCMAPRGTRRRGVGLTRHRPPRACATSEMGCRSVGRAIRWQRRVSHEGSYFVLRTVRGVTRQLVSLRLVRVRARKRERKVRPARGPVEVGRAGKGGADMLSPAQRPLALALAKTGRVGGSRWADANYIQSDAESIIMDSITCLSPCYLGSRVSGRADCYMRASRNLGYLRLQFRTPLASPLTSLFLQNTPNNQFVIYV